MKRQNTSQLIKTKVWIRAAGHCELCGKNLLEEIVALKNFFEGEVAHIRPAAMGPRATEGYSEEDARRLTNDIDNLMLLCPNCHTSIDKADDGVYRAEDLVDRHQGYVERIQVAATTPHNELGAGIIVVGKHFSTKARIEPSELQRAMFAQAIRPIQRPLPIELPEIIDRRTAVYYESVRHLVTRRIESEFAAARSQMGDEPLAAIAGLADIPSLMIVGNILGDRRRRTVFHLDRDTRLQAPDPQAELPTYAYTPPPDSEGPLALVINVSATIPLTDVLAALPGARVATFAALTPSLHHVRHNGFIAAFREQLQVQLSVLEASTVDAIHVFAAIPGAYAIEFGALLSLNHQHGYRIFDRDDLTKAFCHHLDFHHHPSQELAA